eukprot:symbB.v1.2.022738.t1/scaffold2035.1/size91677/4
MLTRPPVGSLLRLAWPIRSQSSQRRSWQLKQAFLAPAVLAVPVRQVRTWRRVATSPRRLEDFQVGDSVVGQVVQIYCPGGISVDVGCSETLAFLEVEEFKDGFPDQGPFRFRVGETVHARVLDVNPSARTEDHGEPDPFGEHGDTGKLHLTLRSGPLERPERYMADTTKAAKLDAFENISKKEWLDGEVVMMSDWAVYVKVSHHGERPFVGILERQNFAASFAEEVIRGCHVQVRILEVDLESRRLLLTMLDE